MFPLAASVVFIALLVCFSTSAISCESITAPLHKLKRPTVLLISSDGFRFDYLAKTPTPNIHRLIQDGTIAKDGLVSVFPTETFPNHYSIVTGLYPPHHGIIMNKFTDPTTGKKFTTTNTDPEMWLGEPLWETVVKANLKAASYFWPGSEVKKGAWDCPEQYCPKFASSGSFEKRVDDILAYFDEDDASLKPSLMTLYFDDPDKQGHIYGNDNVNVPKAIVKIDDMIGRLIKGLETRGVFEDVHIILLGDHGMIGVCDNDAINVDDLVPYEWIESFGAVLGIRPPGDADLPELVRTMNEALRSGKVENGEKLKVSFKEDLPSRLHYSASERIPPIIGLLEEGFTVADTRSKHRKRRCGEHGYDNKFLSMRSIFIGHGPQFERGRKVESFENVQIYNVVTKILNIPGAPNDGSDKSACQILKPGSCSTSAAKFAEE